MRMILYVVHFHQLASCAVTTYRESMSLHLFALLVVFQHFPPLLLFSISSSLSSPSLHLILFFLLPSSLPAFFSSSFWGTGLYSCCLNPPAFLFPVHPLRWKKTKQNKTDCVTKPPMPSRWITHSSIAIYNREPKNT